MNVLSENGQVALGEVGVLLAGEVGAVEVGVPTDRRVGRPTDHGGERRVGTGHRDVQAEIGGLHGDRSGTRRMSGGHEDVGLELFEVAQVRREVLLGHRRHLDLQLDTLDVGEGVLQRGAERLSPGVIGDDGSDPREPLLLDVLGDRISDHRRRRDARAERVTAVLGEDRLGSGLHQEHRRLQLLGDASRSEADIAGDDPADGHGALLDQPLDAAGSRFGVRLVVDHPQLQRPAGDTAGGVELVDGELHAVAHLHAPRRERSGQRRQRADDDRIP